MQHTFLPLALCSVLVALLIALWLSLFDAEGHCLTLAILLIVVFVFALGRLP